MIIKSKSFTTFKCIFSSTKERKMEFQNKIKWHGDLLLSCCCIKGSSTCFRPWKFSTLVLKSATPGIVPSARNASPAKSLAVSTSWSITVKEIIAPSPWHCSSVTENSKHSSKIGFSVFWKKYNNPSDHIKRKYLGGWNDNLGSYISYTKWFIEIYLHKMIYDLSDVYNTKYAFVYNSNL